MLLLGTAVLYLRDLGASGWGNNFYAAAAQAGTKSWKAFLFGSFDSSNAITVDKPPLFLWPMEISGRIFGFSSWSMLVPQALEGVAAVWLLYAAVRRWFGHWTGILAGTLLAITPVAALMFRFNNPDAAMVLLMVAAAYCATRAVEAAATRWVVTTGALMGFAFLAKALQPFTLLPALAVMYLVAAPTPLRRRLWQLGAAAGALVAAAGWWLAIVSLTPAADRPYIGGSTDNSALELIFGFNGLSRLSGSGQSQGSGGFSGSPGLGRLFNSLDGGQISWLLPAALLAVVALALLTRRTGRTDRTRAALLLWGGWLLVTAGVLSFASGIIHTYYTIELAPAIAALVAIGTMQLWLRRGLLLARLTLGAGALGTEFWTWELLHRTSSYPWLGYLVVLAGVVAAGLLLLHPATLSRLLALALAACGLAVLVGGSAAYAIETAGTPHTGSIPSAGPSASAGFSGGGGVPGGRGRGGFPGGGERPAGAPPNGFPGAGADGLPGGGTLGSPPQLPSGARPNGGGGRLGGGGNGTVSSALTKLLKSAHTPWAAAAVGSQSAGPLELASGTAVLSIGGFGGSDPYPTLARFEALVHAGKIHYFVADGTGGGSAGGPAGGPGGGPGGRGTSSAITQWVAAHYTATSVGGTTVYDLTTPTS